MLKVSGGCVSTMHAQQYDVYYVYAMADGTDFIFPDMDAPTLDSSTKQNCIMIQTNYDNDPMNVEKLFKVTLPTSTASATVVYMPDMATVTIANRMSMYCNALILMKMTSLFILVLPPGVIPSTNKVTIEKITTFSVDASFGGRSFQWLFNSRNINDNEKYSGTTTSILIITNIQPEDEGSYACIVTTSFGVDITSQPAQLEVCKCLYPYHNHTLSNIMHYS